MNITVTAYAVHMCRHIIVYIQYIYACMAAKLLVANNINSLNETLLSGIYQTLMIRIITSDSVCLFNSPFPYQINTCG